MSDSEENVSFSENREVGTHIMDDYPTYEEWISNFDMENETPNMKGLEKYHFSKLPIWSENNVYLAGAKSFRGEKNKFVCDCDSKKIKIDVNDEKDCIVFESNIFELIKDFKASMVHTSTLGTAFEPEQPFENPDGTPISFDLDYFGNKRGIDVLPGPFARFEDKYIVWKKKGL